MSDRRAVAMESTMDQAWLAAGVVGLIALVALGGCWDTGLSSGEEQALRDIYRSGLEMQQDPYVRAETLRALELTGDDELADRADDLIRDTHPMVRVAALRTMVYSDHPRARQRALLLFNRGDEQERYHIFEVAVRSTSDTLRRAIIERALRDDSARLRRRALEEGLLRKIDEARDAGDEELLRQDLLPEMGNYIDDSHPEIAALALRTITESGREGWADEFIDKLGDSSNDVQVRIDAARTLVFAGIEEADPLYTEILEDVGAYDPDALGVPERQIDDRLLRLAVLGKTMLGDAEFVDPAMRYLDGASTEETLEVLQVLAGNPDPDASIALRTHMRDANREVRRQAIALYGGREDSRPDALIGALRHDDYQTQQMIVAILAQRFSDRWVEYLKGRLEDSNPGTVEETLRSMQLMLRTDEELDSISDLADRLQQLAMGQGLSFAVDDQDEAQRQHVENIASIAAYLLFRVSDEGAFREVIRENPDAQTRYAYLEHLVMHEPGEHVDTFRDHLYDDLYALRLMAATGLWRVFRDELNWPSVDEGDGDEE